VNGGEASSAPSAFGSSLAAVVLKPPDKNKHAVMLRLRKHISIALCIDRSKLSAKVEPDIKIVN
jgi:hypothetical protein